MPLYGYNRPGIKISEGVRNSFWLQGMMAGFPAMRETCHELADKGYIAICPDLFWRQEPGVELSYWT
jgi:hypothetical protein